VGKKSVQAENLLSLAVTVAGEHSVQGVLDNVVKGLALQPGIALARVWLLMPGDLCDSCFMRSECRDQTQCLHLVASAGTPEKSPKEDWSFLQGHFRRMPLHARKTGVIGATGNAILIEDFAARNEWIARPDWASREGIRAFAGHPLVFRGKTLGVLAVFSRIPLDEQCFAWLRIFADQAAVAIANARAFEDQKHAEAAAQRSEIRLRTLLSANNAIIRHLSENDLLPAVSRTLSQTLAFDFAGVALYDQERDVFRVLAVEGNLDYFRPGREVSREGNSVGWVFEHRSPLVRGDLEKEQQYANERRFAGEGMRSQCVVPLLARGNCIGVLAIASTKPGVYDHDDAEFLQEIANQIALAIENMKSYEEIAALKARLETENVYFQEEIRQEHDFDEIVGNSPVLLELLHKVELAAPSDSNILLLGETGSGKELIARAIHARSARKDRPLVKVNCGAIPTGLVESELFGHVKGAFTGATSNRTGRFELANQGTLFLDEIGELPLDTQVKLLRVLQEQEFEPVGSSRTVRVNVRMIAATNRDLEKAVRDGVFRSDLYYRLNVLPLRVPAICERKTDIPQIVMFFLERFSKRAGKKVAGVSQRTMKSLMSYSWPGNVREIQNVIERGVVLTRGSVLDLGPDFQPLDASTANAIPSVPSSDVMWAHAGDTGSSPIPLSLEELERRHILSVLEHTQWVINGEKGAAIILGIHPSTLRSRMDKLGILRRDHDISRAS
jgi:formate hydrogenlyase transcriptional activator